MKKIFTIISLFTAAIASAQITITQSDLPNAGYGYMNAVDSIYSAPIPAGGTNQIWNYASLLDLADDSVLFIQASGTPYASQFPLANLATFDVNTGGYAYFINNATGLYLNGGNFMGLVAAFNPANMFIPVPFTYNDTYNGFGRLQFDTVYVDSTLGTLNVRLVQYNSITINADGWGSLTIPNAAIPNTLRIKTTTLQTDSIYLSTPFGYIPLPGFTPIQTLTNNYKWLRNGNGTLVLSIDADSLGTTAINSSYLKLFITMGLNDEPVAQSINVFPNPASDIVNINLLIAYGESATVEIYTVTGKLIETNVISQTNMFSFSTSGFSNGAYFYKVKNSSGIMETGKFFVVH